jgi:hypothetical protein
VPVVAIDEDRKTIFRKHQIGCAAHGDAAVQAESRSFPMERAAEL